MVGARSSVRSRRVAALALVTAISAACADAPAPAPAGDASLAVAPRPRVRPPADLASVARATALAYRRDGAALVAAGPAFESRVDHAALAITPRRASSERGAPLSLATTWIGRGGVRADGGGSDPTLAPDGSVAIARGDVVETIADDDAGVEQSWSFARAPAGDGDLVIRVRARGEAPIGATDHGLHFSGGALGLRYGTATWVDADGRRTVVPPTFDGDAIVLVVPDRVVRASRFPAVLDPTITAESEIDKPITGSSASGDQYSPAIASAGGGKGYFAVWYDRRGVRPALYGARIASDGTVVDQTGVAIASGVGYTQPSIAASADGYIVTWGVATVDLYEGPGIYAVRLDANGAPLDKTPLVLAQNQTNAQLPTAAFDGADWLVAWQRYAATTSYDVAAARVPKSGAPDGVVVDVSNATDAEYQPIVSFDGDGWLVSWRTYQQVFGRRIGKDGKPASGPLVLATAATGSLYNFHAAFDGARHLIAWSEYGQATASQDIYARRVDTTGAAIDAGPLPVSVDANYDDRPRVVFDGTSFLVAFSRNNQLAAARLDPTNGALLDNPAVVLAAGQYYDFGLASDGAASIAVDREYGGSTLVGSDVRGLRIAKAPAPGAAEFVVSKASNSETEPVAAWNGSQHMTAWLDTREGRPAIYGARVSRDGAPSAPVTIASDARFTDVGRPRIASYGAGWIVVFAGVDTTGRSGVHGVPIDASGKPGAIFDVTTASPSGFEQDRDPDVSFDGAHTLVVWEQQTNDGTGIAGVRFAPGATTPVDKAPLRISTVNPIERRTSPAISFDGKTWFVAWTTIRPTAGSIEVSHVYGTRVSKDGNPLDGETAVCTAFLMQRAPAVAGDPTRGGFFVTWEDYRTALDTADVYGARIGADGQNLDGATGMKISVAATDESRPRVSASGDGTNWVVAWRDLRSKESYDLYGAWISKAGTNHDPKGLLLSAEAGDEEAPWMSPSGGGKLLVAYERLDPTTGYGSYRVRARVIDGGKPTATPCTSGDECASRSCADGVCCATECGACGVCNVTPGTCTPVAAGTETPTCPNYQCKGTLECPSRCDTDADCASNATCDPNNHACVSRVFCVDAHTLKDLSGKTTDCAPFRCAADACRTECGSVDDCAAGFVCDYGGRCILPPGANDGGCASAPRGRSTTTWPLVIAALAAGFAARARRRSGRQCSRM